MKRHNVAAAAVAAALLLPAAARVVAGQGYYGVVDSYSGDQVTIRTDATSFGHWLVDQSTHLDGAPVPGDWVYADVDAAGHVSTLHILEHPVGYSGVVRSIRNTTLVVQSGQRTYQWNLAETTSLQGVDPAKLAPGDEVAVKVYRNHNLAELRLVKQAGSGR